MRYFGFFKGMKYGKCEDDFEVYKHIRNSIEKSTVLQYLKKLPIAAVAPMSVQDIFTGEPIEQAGVIEDGDFMFPLDFIHYYENYDIGIPVEYENYIRSAVLSKKHLMKVLDVWEQNGDMFAYCIGETIDKSFACKKILLHGKLLDVKDIDIQISFTGNISTTLKFDAKWAKLLDLKKGANICSY